MPTFKLTPQAESDLIEIGIYTEERHGIKQRNTYLTQLDNRFQWLAENPGLGLNRDEVKEGYNSFLEGEHIIFYRIVGNNIAIIGIPHQRMDVKKHL